MRNMSFQLTQEQILNRTKTVTRRLGWKTLKAGDIIRAVDKCMGLKKGQKPKQLAVLRVKSISEEWLCHIVMHDHLETAREGFPELNCGQFVAMFCREMKCNHADTVRRIEFEYVEEGE